MKIPVKDAIRILVILVVSGVAGVGAGIYQQDYRFAICQGTIALLSFCLIRVIKSNAILTTMLTSKLLGEISEQMPEIKPASDEALKELAEKFAELAEKEKEL